MIFWMRTRGSVTPREGAVVVRGSSPESSSASGSSSPVSTWIAGGGRRRRGDLARLDRRGEVGVEVLRLRQLGELVQAEAHEEVLRRAVEERRPDDRLLARRRDELLLEERLQDARGVHAADVLDLGKRDRLAVGDDRERLERREREPAPLGDLVELAQQRVELGPRDEAPAARDLLEPHAAVLALGPRGQPLEGRRDGLRRRFQQVRQVLLPHGLRRGEEHRLQGRQDPLDRGLAGLGLGGGFGRGGAAVSVMAAYSL